MDGCLLQRLRSLVEEAESEALAVLGQAAASGDYESIDRARSIAEGLRSLRTSAGMGLGHDESGVAVTERGSSSRSSRRRLAKAKSRDYPRFHVSDGSLYKTGWSKKKREEYIHRVPLERVHAVLDLLEGLNRRIDGPVEADRILEEQGHDHDAVPSYQVYIVLALLKQKGIVTSAGRDGYLVEANVARRALELLEEIGE